MERLHGRKDFQRVLSTGQRVQNPFAALVFVPREEISCAPSVRSTVRMGFCVGRQFGSAVRRNRLKRRLREASRLELAQDTSARRWDVVCIPRSRAVEADFPSLRFAIRDLLIRAGIAESDCEPGT